MYGVRWPRGPGLRGSAGGGCGSPATLSSAVRGTGLCSDLQLDRLLFGINGGGGWGRSQWDGVDKFDISGGLIGGTIGYNWQFGQAVIGAEGDIDWTRIKGTTTTLCAPGCTTRNHWLATVRGRVGYALDRFLPYLTAGLAVGDIAATVPPLPAGTSNTAGWTVGGGLEVGIASNVSVKAEYLYVDLGTFNCGLNCGLVPTGNVSFSANLFRGGLNVRF